MSAESERLLPPNEPSAFESLCLDLWKDIWGDPGAQKNGRSGQPQAGVDVFGQSSGNWIGVQCKQKDGLLRTKLTTRELELEVECAFKFKPELARFILATSGPRDVKLQERARQITVRHRRKRLFSVEVWSWEDIWHEVYGREELLRHIGPTYWPKQWRLIKDRQPRVSEGFSDRSVLTGQPLVSLELSWEFCPNKLIAAFAKKFETDLFEQIAETLEGNLTASDMQDELKQYVLYPLLLSLADGTLEKVAQGKQPQLKNRDSSCTVLTLVSLDSSQNSILPFGFVTTETTWTFENQTKLVAATLAGGVDFIGDFNPCGPPQFKRKRRVNQAPSVDVSENDSVAINWQLDPVSLLNAVDRKVNQIPLMANFPETLKLLLLHNFADLRFKSGNFAESFDFNVMDSKHYKECISVNCRHVLASSILTLVPNNLDKHAYRYQVVSVTEGGAVDDNYEELDGQFIVVELRMMEHNLRT